MAHDPHPRPDGHPTGALSLSAPESRMSDRRIGEVGQALRRAARQASEMLRATRG